MNTTASSMPMGIAANRLSLEDEILPDLNLGGGRAPLSLDAPTAMPQGMPPSPAPNLAQSTVSPAVPWNVKLQSDGSSVYSVPGPDGSDIILSVNPAPKLPKALQPAPTQPKQNGQQPSPIPMQ